MNESKVCFKCGVEKPLAEFYKHPMMKDGRVNKCKECNKLDVRQNRKRRLDYYRAYDRNRANDADRVFARSVYAKTDEGHAAARRANRIYADRYPLRYEAHCAVGNAIRDGRLVRQDCEVCGMHDVHAHHDDYTKPLEVRWLCEFHHQEWHRNNVAFPPPKSKR